MKKIQDGYVHGYTIKVNIESRLLIVSTPVLKRPTCRQSVVKGQTTARQYRHLFAHPHRRSHRMQKVECSNPDQDGRELLKQGVSVTLQNAGKLV